MTKQDKKTAEMFEAHHAHWREKYENEPYYREGYTYDDYGPAYAAGLDAAAKHPDRSFDDHESALAHEWRIFHGDSRLDWKEASPAVRAAWERMKLHHLDG